MKPMIKTTALFVTLSMMVYSCKKKELSLGEAPTADVVVEPSEAKISDSISYAATQEIADKKFIKTAEITMEVKNVYDATIAIEKNLKTLGGFVTSSKMNSQILSEDTYNTSDKEAVLVRKYQMDNRMQVKIPTQNLGEFLQKTSDEKLFLTSRIINAEDVSAEMKLAELEAQRISKTGKDISTLKNTPKKVNYADENRSENNQQQYATLQMNDQLKYSTVDLYLNEPKISVSTIAVANTHNIDNQYKMNFFYGIKNAIVDGFYVLQKLIIGLFTIWPLFFVGGLVYYFIRMRKTRINTSKKEM